MPRNCFFVVAGQRGCEAEREGVREYDADAGVIERQRDRDAKREGAREAVLQ